MHRLVRIALTVSLLSLLAATSVAQHVAYQFKQTPHDSVTISAGDRPLLRYMHAPLNDATKEAREQTYKVFHHVFDPADGSRLVTKGPGGQYTHHRGLYFGWNKVSYGDGKKADVWHCSGDAFQSHEKFLKQDVTADKATQAVLIHWHGPLKEVFAEEERELQISSKAGASAQGTQIDFFSTVRTKAGPIMLDGDPQHAGFHFRADNEVAEKTKAQTYYLRPDGKDEPGKTRNWDHKGRDPRTVNLAWNAMSFMLGEQRYTALYIDHPQNPKEARYSERDYGRFGSYFEYQLTDATPLKVKYRVWLQRGELTVEQCSKLAAEFVSTTK